MIIGSTALKYHGISVGEPKDLDVMITANHPKIMYPDNTDIVVIPKHIYKLIFKASGYCTPADILTIKMSHMAWDTKWDKTKRHVLCLLHLGYKPNKSLYLLLKHHWQSVYGSKDHLSLAKTKSKFFNDYVTYVYDHDYLHELVSYPKEPTYLSCLKNNEEVLICKSKFDLLSHDQQLSMFREEITVIAVERWLVNPINKGKICWTKAYSMALKKVITSLTKNWATDFVIFNLPSLYKPDYNYFKYALKMLGVEMKVDLQQFKELCKRLNADDAYLDSMIYHMSDDMFEDFIWEHTDYPANLDYNSKKDKVLSILDELDYEHLYQDGGGEGGAENCEGVFRLGDTIYSASYSYYSYEGYDYTDIQDTLREVKPVEKTITVYE